MEDVLRRMNELQELLHCGLTYIAVSLCAIIAFIIEQGLKLVAKLLFLEKDMLKDFYVTFKRNFPISSLSRGIGYWININKKIKEASKDGSGCIKLEQEKKFFANRVYIAISKRVYSLIEVFIICFVIVMLLIIGLKSVFWFCAIAPYVEKKVSFVDVVIASMTMLIAYLTISRSDENRQLDLPLSFPRNEIDYVKIITDRVLINNYKFRGIVDSDCKIVVELYYQENISRYYEIEPLRMVAVWRKSDYPQNSVKEIFYNTEAINIHSRKDYDYINEKRCVNCESDSCLGKGMTYRMSWMFFPDGFKNMAVKCNIDNADNGRTVMTIGISDEANETLRRYAEKPNGRNEEHLMIYIDYIFTNNMMKKRKRAANGIYIRDEVLLNTSFFTEEAMGEMGAFKVKQDVHRYMSWKPEFEKSVIEGERL